MDRWHLDLVHAFRSLGARPGASAAIVVTLATGIGLAAAMFALADPFVLRPLPYHDPNGLVIIVPVYRPSGDNWTQAPPSIPRLSDWTARDDLFQGVAAFRPRGTVRVRTSSGAVGLQAAEITDNFFDVLGVPAPAWSPAVRSSQDGNAPLMLTADAFGRVFGEPDDGRPRALDRIEGLPVRVVGELPAAFLFPSDRIVRRFDAVTLMTGESAPEASLSEPGEGVSIQSLTVVARLRTGVSVAAVQAALSATLSESGRLAVRVQSVTTYLTRRVRPLAIGALSASVLVLLVCAGNIANLLLARGVYRREEFATRAALGATRSDLVRLVLLEYVLLASGAVIAGLILGRLALDGTRLILPVEYSALGSPAVTFRVVAFACVTALSISPVTLLPMWFAGRGTMVAPPNRTGLPPARGSRGARFVLTAGQSAWAAVLLVGGALLFRSYVNLIGQQPGFTGHVVVVSTLYPDGQVGPLLQRDIDASLDRLRRLVGVSDVAAATGPMIDRVLLTGGILIDGQFVPATLKAVTPAYFKTAGLTFVDGRAFGRGDTGRPVVVNETLARRYSPTGSAIGRPVGRQQGQVIGVVRDSFDVALDQPPGPTVFTWLKDPGGCTGDCNRINYVLRLADRTADVTATARQAVASVNRDAVVEDVSSIDARLAGSIKDRSFATLALGLFAAAALTICLVGLIGMVAFTVARRTREVAIRVAMGAQPRHVVRLVLADTIVAASVGIGAGLLAGRWASHLTEHLLYGVKAADTWTVAMAGVIMLGSSVVAALIPATRALRLSPVAALREE